MKICFPFGALVLLLGLVANSPAADGVVDLTTLAPYATQTIPNYITKNNTTAGNGITNIGATLGRVLFYDKRLSRDNTISCASCHQQARAFSDTATASVGVAGTTGRHAMRLINERFSTEVHFFWDERAATLEAQTSQPIQNHVEMGFSGTSGDPNFVNLVTKLSAIEEYRVLFAATFGSTAISEDRVQKALAQFVRSIQSFDSKYDTGRAAAGNDNVNFGNFTAAENAGKQLFLAGPPGGAGCAGCHRPPEFDIDPATRNNGVIASIGGGTDLTNTRSPSLRDLVGPAGQSNGAFMHNGSLVTLAQVIDHYNAIPADNADLDPRLRRPGGGVQNLGLNQTQKNNLVAFLQTLTGTAVYTDTKWSTPFNATGQLSLIILPSNAISIRRNANGTVTVSAQAAPNLTYQLQSATTLPNWGNLATVTANAAGLAEYTLTPGATLLFRFVYQVPAS